ncbi:MAG: hypothetical protein Q6353_020370 [Candidatus Sigynarchaeum springense]
MPGFQVLKEREFPESVKQIAWNEDEKQPLFSVIVEGSPDIVIISPDGEQKHVLSGHAEPVVSHAWLLPDTIASVSAEGEVRVWTIRGSRFDCTRIKDKYPHPRGIVAIPTAKKNDARFLVWYQDATIAVFEPGKPATVTKEWPGNVLAVCALENAIIVLYHEQGSTAIKVLDLNLVEKRSWPIMIDDTPVQAIGLKIDVDIFGCIILCKSGTIVSCTTKDNKVHSLEKRDEISAIHVERDTRMLFLGMKSGLVHAVSFRPDLSFIDTIATFEAHEFKITALAFNKRLLLLVLGCLDGVLKITRVDAGSIQKVSQISPKPGVDWKDRERAESKIRQADDAIERGDLGRAGELLEAVRRSAIPDLVQRVEQSQARLNAKAAEQQKVIATRQKLIEFLDRVAEERGEILLAEISKALSMPMADVKRWIKALDAEMEWEYIEQNECLILFDRMMSITRETDIERQMIVENDERYRPKGVRRQLGRRRPAERPGRYPAQQWQAARQHGARPASRAQLPAARISGSDIKMLAQAAAGISGKMQASILGPDLKVFKTIAVPDLVPVLETISQPAGAIVTDGIISPRLAANAEKVGVKYIVGQRLHPNLDRAAINVDCIELHELESRMSSFVAGSDARETRDMTSTPRTDLEGKLLAVISTTKWQSIEEILSSANIKDDFERNLAKIKLKQLVASGTLVSEVVNNILYFIQATK